jgi:exopolysaccharide production protein ExoY
MTGMDVTHVKHRRRIHRSSWSRDIQPRRRRSNGTAYYPRAHAITDPVLIACAEKANGAIKRLLDFSAALAGLIVFSPILLTAGLLIWSHDGGSILYGHKRVGRKGRLFRCWKLRSMVRHGDEVLAAYLAANPDAEREWRETRKLADDPRVTKIGRFIRKTSIDELPQLWNVLVGDMSLIGPRPITREELDRYGKDRRYYLLVRPGITGLWQVSGRSNISYEERVQLDMHYVRNWSLWLDLQLLWQTVPAVLRGTGAY